MPVIRDLKTTDIAGLFEVDRETVKRWAADGCPHDGGGKGRSLLFNHDEVEQWCEANNKTGERGRPSDAAIASAPEDVKRRYAVALADWREQTAEVQRLKVQRERGLLVAIAEVEAANVQKFTLIRKKFEALPTAASLQCFGKSQDEIERILKQQVRDILVVLSQS